MHRKINQVLFLLDTSIYNIVKKSPNMIFYTLSSDCFFVFKFESTIIVTV